jgi:2-(1,2-epoxy-1,2-dihydrophenyl)acetyl-CoA isomerase
MKGVCSNSLQTPLFYSIGCPAVLNCDHRETTYLSQPQTDRRNRMETAEFVTSEFTQGVLQLTLNRPKANAFNIQMITELHSALRIAAKKTEVRVVLLTGEGQIFSAGQDVKEFGQVSEAGELSFRQHLLRTYNPLILQIRQLEKPVLAAVNGPVAGAALGIALACDLRIAADTARFVVGFLGIGLAPDSGISLFLPSLIGLGRAAEYAFSNQPISAEQALDWGLINRVVPASDLASQAHSWAQELAEGPIQAMGLAKRDFNRAVYPNLEQVLDYEAHIQEIAGHGPDHHEGLQSFIEKRQPKYA